MSKTNNAMNFGATTNTQLIIGSNTAGPNNLGVIGNAAIGTYTSITAPNNGLIISGIVGCGTSAPSLSSQVNVVSTNAYGLLANGSQTSLDGSTDQFAILANGTLHPTASAAIVAGIGSNCVFSANTAISLAAGLYSNVTLNTNSGTIANAYGAYIDIGTAITGTVTNNFGLFVNTPTGGTNKYTGVFFGTTTTLVGIGTTTPINTIDVFGAGAIGSYAGVNTAPSNGLLVSGIVGFGTSTPNTNSELNVFATNAYGIIVTGTQTSLGGNNQQFSIVADGTLRPTTPTSTAMIGGVAAICALAAPTATSTITTASGFYSNITLNTNSGTITNACGAYIDVGTAITGTVTNAYGLYVNTPTGGTNPYTAVFFGTTSSLVGIGITNPTIPLTISATGTTNSSTGLIRVINANSNTASANQASTFTSIQFNDYTNTIRSSVDGGAIDNSDIRLTNLPVTTNLVGTGGSGGDQGYSAAISADGNTVASGSPLDSSQVGAVWIFTRSNSTWTQQAKITTTGEIGVAEFGASVALSADGNTLAGGGSEDNSLVGAVWIFTRSGSTWTQQAKLIGTSNIGHSNQGASVALSADGNTLAFGGPNDMLTVGAVWVFTRSGSTWTQQAKLIATGGTANQGQGFAVSLSADGNTLAFCGNINTWTFTRSGGTWTQQTLFSGTPCALSADGNTLSLGSGAIWIQSSGTWSQQATITTGNAVSLSGDGNDLILGKSFSSNQVLLFHRSGTAWTQMNPVIGNALGNPVSLAISAQSNTWVFGSTNSTITVYEKGYLPKLADSTTNLVEQVRVNRLGQLSVGTPTPDADFQVGAPTGTAYSASLDSSKALIFGFQSTNTAVQSSVLSIVDNGGTSYQGNGGGITFAGRVSNSGTISAFGRIRGSKDTATDNTFLGRITLEYLNATGLTEGLRLNSSGNVGIATTTPINTLDVFGAEAIGTYAGVNTAPSNGLIVSGSVGIGTNSPINKLDVFGAEAIGTYAGVNTAPSNGLIVSGIVGCGTSSPNTSSELNVFSTNAYGLITTGSQTSLDASSHQFAILANGTLNPTSPTNTSIVAGIASSPTLKASTGATIPIAAGFYSNLTLTTNSGTITNACGVYIDAGTPNSGTVENEYGLYVNTPAGGDSSYTAVFTGTNTTLVGIGTAAPSGFSTLNLVPSPNVPLGIHISGTQSTSSDLQQKALVAATSIFVSSGGTAIGISSETTFLATTLPQTLAAGFYCNNDLSSNSGTITNASGVYIEFGSEAGGTVTNAYGLYVNTPVGGTNLYTAVFFGATTTLVGIGTVAPSVTSTLNVSSNNTAYGILANGTQTSLDASGHQFAILANGTLNPTSPTNASIVAGVASSPTLKTSIVGTIPIAAGFYSNLTLTTNSGTITNACGAYIDVGTTNSGTVTNGIGLYVNTPLGGTNKYTAIFFGTSTTVVGIGTTTPVSISTLNVSSTYQAYNILSNGTQTGIDGGNNQFGIVAAGTMNPTATASIVAGIVSQCIFNSNTGTTITTAAGFYSKMTLNTNTATITNACGVYIDTGTASTNTVTNGIGLYVNTPLGGTNKYTALFTGGTPLVGVGTATPSHTLDVTGTTNLNGIVTKPGNTLFIFTNTSTISGTTTGGGAVLTLTFNNTVANVSGTATAGYGLNGGTGVFTAPATGYYHFSASVNISNISSSMTSGSLRIAINGSARNFLSNMVDFAAVAPSTSSNYTAIINCIANMSSGDTAVLQLFIAGGSNSVTIVGDPTFPATWFMGNLIG